MIIAFAGSTAPNGWFICDGREVSRTEYSRLFALIGITYGNGDGTTTFNIPNLQDRFLQGASATNVIGTKKEAGLPNIKGTLGFVICGEGIVTDGAFLEKSYSKEVSGGCGSAGSFYTQGNGPFRTYFKASNSNSVYNDDCNTVQPPSVCINYIIKY